jgi:hypothetical protein
VDIQSKGFAVPDLQTIADQEAANLLQCTPQLPNSLKKISAQSKLPVSAMKPPADLANPAQPIKKSTTTPTSAAQLAPAAEAKPAASSTSERALQQQLVDMAANFANQLAAMQAQLQTATTAPPSSVPDDPTIINIDATVTSPMKDLNFNLFYIVQQYSPAVTHTNLHDFFSRSTERQTSSLCSGSHANDQMV